jgi:CRISPR system Cascade subunit CasC
MNNMYIQIHSLTPFGPSLVNRDDFGHAKSISLGGVTRTRISSQCLKYHWRLAEGPNTLADLGMSYQSVRTRDLINSMLIPAISEEFSEDVLEITAKIMNEAVYGQGDSKKSTAKKADTEEGESEESGDTKTTMLLFGAKEIVYLRERTRAAANIVNEMKAHMGVEKISAQDRYSGPLLDDPEAKLSAKQKKAGVAAIEVGKKIIAKAEAANFKAMRQNADLPAGITGALFGRMVTGDRNADIDGAVSVAHSITVHAQETEIDPFTAVDDLVSQGSGHMGESELNTGLFYGYTVINLRDLLDNLSGDKELAAKIARSLLYMIAEPRMSGKAGSTAPFTRASSLVVAAGDRAPMSYVDAFREPTESDTFSAMEAMSDHAKIIDYNYDIKEERRHMVASPELVEDMPFGDRTTVAEMADWIETKVNEAADALA